MEFNESFSIYSLITEENCQKFVILISKYQGLKFWYILRETISYEGSCVSVWKLANHFEYLKKWLHHIDVKYNQSEWDQVCMHEETLSCWVAQSKMWCHWMSLLCNCYIHSKYESGFNCNLDVWPQELFEWLRKLSKIIY